MLPFVYYINLDRSTERRAHMQAALDARGVAHARIEAVDGREPAALAAAIRGAGDRPAEAACVASHLRAVRQAWRDGHDVVIVLEDDASFALLDGWPEGWQRLSAALPPRFGMLSLCVGEEPHELDRLYRKTGDVVRFGDCLYWGAVAYAIDRPGMASLLRAFERNGGFDVTAHPGPRCSESVLMHTLAADPDIDGPFVARISLFCWADFPSEIHLDHAGHQERARSFMLRHHAALRGDRYTSPFPLRAAIDRWRGR